jgi:hypothetical protein
MRSGTGNDLGFAPDKIGPGQPILSKFIEVSGCGSDGDGSDIFSICGRRNVRRKTFAKRESFETSQVIAAALIACCHSIADRGHPNIVVGRLKDTEGRVFVARKTHAEAPREAEISLSSTIIVFDPEFPHIAARELLKCQLRALRIHVSVKL